MIGVLLIAICAVVADPSGEAVVCRVGRSDAMPMAECEAKRQALVYAVQPESMLSVDIRCVAPGAPA